MDYSNSWNKEELKAYLLIYFANADFTESTMEREYIKSHVSLDNLDSIHLEFEKDNDFESIQKIRSAIERLNYSKEEKDQLINEIGKLISTDGKIDIVELNLLRSLKHLIY